MKKTLQNYGYWGHELRALPVQWTWESTKASPTQALPTNGCPSKQEEPCSSHQDTQQRWKALECQRWEWGKQEKSTPKLCPAMLGEAAVPTGRDNPSSGLPLLRGKISHFRKGICNHKPKPNEDAEQDTTSELMGGWEESRTKGA